MFSEPSGLNWVSSQTDRQNHKVEPFHCSHSFDEVKNEIVKFLTTQMQGELLQEEKNSFEIICRTTIFRFKDHLKFKYLVDEGVLHVFSKSLMGYYDFGVNRKRIENLRRHLISMKLILP